MNGLSPAAVAADHQGVPSRPTPGVPAMRFALALAGLGAVACLVAAVPAAEVTSHVSTTREVITAVSP